MNTYRLNTGTYQQHFLNFKTLISEESSNYLELEIFRAFNNIYNEYAEYDVITNYHQSELIFLEIYNTALLLNISNELLVIKNFMNNNINIKRLEKNLESAMDKIISYIASKKGNYQANTKNASNDYIPVKSKPINEHKNYFDYL